MADWQNCRCIKAWKESIEVIEVIYKRLRFARWLNDPQKARLGKPLSLAPAGISDCFLAKKRDGTGVIWNGRTNAQPIILRALPPANYGRKRLFLIAGLTRLALFLLIRHWRESWKL
jgi:hypothetical protein